MLHVVVCSLAPAGTNGRRVQFEVTSPLSPEQTPIILSLIDQATAQHINQRLTLRAAIRVDDLSGEIVRFTGNEKTRQPGDIFR